MKGHVPDVEVQSNSLAPGESGSGDSDGDDESGGGTVLTAVVVLPDPDMMEATDDGCVVDGWDSDGDDESGGGTVLTAVVVLPDPDMMEATDDGCVVDGWAGFPGVVWEHAANIALAHSPTNQAPAVFRHLMTTLLS